MKSNFSRIVAMILALFMCAAVFTACNDASSKSDEHLKLTEQMIRSKMADSYGTLTIDSGSADDVTAFSYVFESTAISSLKSKEITRSVVKEAQSGKSLTYHNYLVYTAFCDTMQVVGLIYDKENFDGDAYIEELLSILCDGSTKTYNGWTVSVTMDQSTESITIKCYV